MLDHSEQWIEEAAVCACSWWSLNLNVDGNLDILILFLFPTACNTVTVIHLPSLLVSYVERQGRAGQGWHGMETSEALRLTYSIHSPKSPRVVGAYHLTYGVSRDGDCPKVIHRVQVGSSTDSFERGKWELGAL